MLSFLLKLELLSDKIDPLVFQFEYLNKQKMPGGLLLDVFEEFAGWLEMTT